MPTGAYCRLCCIPSPPSAGNQPPGTRQLNVLACQQRQIRERERDAVIVWHRVRLTGRPIEEEFVQACPAGGVTDVVTLHGDMNRSSGVGMLMARIMAAGAQTGTGAEALPIGMAAPRLTREQAPRAAPCGPESRHPGGHRPERAVLLIQVKIANRCPASLRDGRASIDNRASS